MKYKVGDKVRVREDLKVGKRYGAEAFIDCMGKYAGKTMTVKARFSNGEYHLKEDAGNCLWTDEMLEDVESISILVAANKVIAKKDNKVGIAKCSPEDEFDIFVGAKLALGRLEEQFKPYDWYDYDGNNDEVDKRLINRGLVFKTAEEAIECAKKMLEVVK